MPINKAQDYFHGKEGFNCAQSVIKAFENVCGLSPELVEEFKSSGAGRAEGGLCGALFAAKAICSDKDTSEFEKVFSEKAGDYRCRRIRVLKKISCKECVKQAAELIVDCLKK